MVQKITCPECNAEFDLAEVHKKHLKNLENKTRAEAEKFAKKEIQDNKKKAHEWAKEKIKAVENQKYYTLGSIILMFLVLLGMYFVLR